VKDQSREKEFVGALRGGAKLIVKASSSKGTSTTDSYSLKGLSEALARAVQECK
jgi:invasion protein IalB